jgi:hypothetical protein
LASHGSQMETTDAERQSLGFTHDTRNAMLPVIE